MPMGAYVPGGTPGGVGIRGEPGPTQVVAPPGRAAEAARLGMALDALVAGRGSVALLQGEGGVGKTTLSRWMAAEAVGRGVEVLGGTAFALSTDTPYGPLVEAFGARLRRPDGPALAKGLSSLGLLFDGLDLEAPPPVSADLARSRLHGALVTLTNRIAAHRSVVLVIDDLHWADGPSLEVLHALVGELPDLPLLIVAGFRPFEADERHEVRTLVQALRRHAVAEVVDVDRLDRGTIEGLLRSRLGPLLSRRLVDLVWDRSAGTPLVAEELVADLVDRGGVRETALGWDLVGGDEVTVPQVARQLIGDRIDRLEPGARTVLAHVAAAGEPLDDELLGRLDGLDEAPRRAFLDVLVALDLVDRQLGVGGRVRWVAHHPIVAEAALDLLGEGERRAVHLRYVDQLEGSTGPLRLARHALGAGSSLTPERAAPILLRAGREALDRGAPVEAARMLSAALAAAEQLGDDELVAAVLEQLAEAWMRTGEGAVAEEHLRRALAHHERTGVATARSRVLRALVEAAWIGGEIPPELERRVVELADELEQQGEADELIEVLAFLTMVELRSGRDVPAALLERAERVGAALRTERGQLVAETFGVVGELYDLDGLAASEERLASLAGRVEGHDDLVARVLHSRLEWQTVYGDVAGIRAAIRAEQDHAARRGETPTWRVATARFLVALAEGDLDSTDTLELAEYTSNVERGRSYGIALSTCAALGREDADAAVAACSAESAAPRRADDVSAGLVDSARLWSWADPDPEALAARLVAHREQGVRLMTGAGVLSTITYALALDVLGRRAELEQELARWRALDVESRQLTGWASVFASGLADRDGEPRRAARLLVEAAEGFDAAGWTLLAARCRVDAAQRGAAEVDDEALLAASVVVTRAGCCRSPAQAAATLRARGVRTTAPRGEDPLGLTVREREVAAAVSEGLTNRQVAGRLFISVRTVTSHLDHIYTKLGIGSRAELAERLRDEPGPAA